jgi:hypothetical protein
LGALLGFGEIAGGGEVGFLKSSSADSFGCLVQEKGRGKVGCLVQEKGRGKEMEWNGMEWNRRRKQFGPFGPQIVIHRPNSLFISEAVSPVYSPKSTTLPNKLKKYSSA